MTTPRHADLPARMRLALIVLLVVVLLGIFVLPLATASRAAASSPGVLVSQDGVHFSAVYPGALFDAAALMVPMSSQTTRFWVRNGSAEPAYLRISVGAVRGSGTALSSALTVRAATPSMTGSPVALDAASPCYVLAQGQLLAPSATVPVDATLALGDLAGTAGQNSYVDFDILVGLSSAALGSLPATACLTDSGSVPATPGGGTGGTGTPGGTGGTGGVHGTTGDPVPPVGNAVGGVETPAVSDGSAFAGDDGSVGILDANTGRLRQEWWVLLWVLAAVAGGVLCLLVGRRRAVLDEEIDEEEEVTAWVGVPLSGRGAWSTI